MNPQDLIAAAARKKTDDLAKLQAEENAEKQFTASQFESIGLAMGHATQAMMDFLQKQEINTKISNFPTKINTPDADKVVKAIKALEVALKPQVNDDSSVVEAISKMQKSIEAIDITPTEAVEVTNLKDLRDTLNTSLNALLKAVNGLKMEPKINLPAPVVNVEKTDVKSVVTSLKSVEKAVRETASSGGGSVTPTDPLIRYTPVDIDDVPAVQYFGYLDQRGGWYIKKFDTSASPKTLRFCFGNGGSDGSPTNYIAAWAARASQTYNYWGS